MFKVLSRATHTLIKIIVKKWGFLSVYFAFLFFVFLINNSFYLGQNSSRCIKWDLEEVQ